MDLLLLWVRFTRNSLLRCSPLFSKRVITFAHFSINWKVAKMHKNELCCVTLRVICENPVPFSSCSHCFHFNKSGFMYRSAKVHTHCYVSNNSNPQQCDVSLALALPHFVTTKLGLTSDNSTRCGRRCCETLSFEINFENKPFKSLKLLCCAPKLLLLRLSN